MEDSSGFSNVFGWHHTRIHKFIDRLIDKQDIDWSSYYCESGPLTGTNYYKMTKPLATPSPLTCGAKTRSGRPCKNFPVRNKRRCKLHGGLSTGPRTAAGKARIAATHYKHGRYVGYREKQAREKYYRDKIKRIMQQAFEAGLMPE